jgi:hypothetical protein
MTISFRDQGILYRWGMLYAKFQDPEALANAREYLAIADTLERQSVKVWWEEGTRNHARNTPHSNQCVADLLAE